MTCAGLTLNDGPLVAEQRTFAHKYLKGFVLRSNSLEENINLELNQGLEDMGRKHLWAFSSNSNSTPGVATVFSTTPTHRQLTLQRIS